MILVTGATGFVGHKIMEMCENTLPSPSLRDASENVIIRIVEESGADTIIHTAAISDIGVCQEHPEDSYHANVLIPVYLAKAVKACKNIKLICFSSDQVYSGLDDGGPYSEEAVKPANLYAAHKIEMENRVLDIVPDAVMLRAEWMYDYYLKKSNYFMNILNAGEYISVSSGQYRGVTYVKEVAENMTNVIQLPGGVYNFGSETTKSIYEITKAFLTAIGKDVRLEDAPPRHNLWMNCDKARSHGVIFRSVEDGLIACAKDYHMLNETIARG